MSRFTHAQSIEEQLAALDPHAVTAGKYLYVYARPTVRTDYWLLMLHNVYQPLMDVTLSQPNTERDAEIEGAKFALLFDCKLHMIPDFSLERPPHKFRPLPYRDNLAHAIELAVLKVEGGYQAAIRSTRVNLSHAVGPVRESYDLTERDTNIARRFYLPPQKPPQGPREARHAPNAAPAEPTAT